MLSVLMPMTKAFFAVEVIVGVAETPDLGRAAGSEGPGVKEENDIPTLML